MNRIFISDCEGPISKNDNAFELATNFIPNGDSFFTNISKYDDVLADVLRKPGYTAGSTLKLILPFFKAYSITDQEMEEFSAQNMVLLKNSKTTLKHIRTITDAFIVSTSYEHYIKKLCELLDFPFKNTYCTKVNLNKIAISPKEKDRLRVIAQEIARMHSIEIPSGSRTIEDFSHADQAAIQRFDEIFWNEVPQMFVGKFLFDVVTVGGEQKAESIREVTKKLALKLKNVMYVGDSITDVEAFKLLRDKGGLSISFNGNSYAVKNSDVAVISESNLVIAAIAELFCKYGKEETLQIIETWNLDKVKGKIEESIINKIASSNQPKVQIVTAQNMELLIKESSEFRKEVRGVAIGKLG